MSWSHELYEIYGLDAGTFTPTMEAFAGFVHPDDRALVDGVVGKILAGGGRTDFEFRIIAADGSVHELHAVGEVTATTEDGAPSVMVGVNEDITERKRAEAALREAARFDRALAAVEAVIHSSLDFPTVMQTALGEGAAVIGAEQAGTSMHDDEAHAFRVAYVYNHPPDRLGVLIPDSDDIHGVEALRTRRTIAVDDTQSDPRVRRELMDAWHIKSVICAPLIVKGRPVAVTYFSYCTAAHHFSLSEVEFVTKVASSLSIALENAQLYEAARAAQLLATQELATSDFLLEAARRLSGWTDLDGLLNRLAELVLRSTGHSRVSVALLAEDRSQATFVTTVGKVPPSKNGPHVGAALARTARRADRRPHEDRRLQRVAPRAAWDRRLSRRQARAPRADCLCRPGARPHRPRRPRRTPRVHRPRDRPCRGHRLRQPWPSRTRGLARRTAARVEQAAQEERVRLARDLHDSVTQALFAATLKAEALTLAGDSLPDGVTRIAEEVRRLNHGALAEMRTLLLELRGEALEDVSVASLLRHLVEAAEGRSSVRPGSRSVVTSSCRLRCMRPSTASRRRR